MNALVKLSTVALGALAIVGGAALAQSTNPAADSDTANVSISPGSNLKRDSSLSSKPKAAVPMNSATTTDTTSTTTYNSTVTPAAAPVAVAPAPVASTDAALAPRTDRN